jgi:hypothetical protein
VGRANHVFKALILTCGFTGMICPTLRSLSQLFVAGALVEVRQRHGAHGISIVVLLVCAVGENGHGRETLEIAELPIFTCVVAASRCLFLRGR